MKLRVKLLACLLFLAYSFSYGQIKEYDYKRELKGISGQWHKIILPDEVFGKITQDLTDIRIFGITANHDTVEAPYLLRVASEKTSSREVEFNTLNTSHNEKGYSFTFEIPATEPINQINLEFGQKNFDWQIKLEGSQNQNDWFTVAENYRILSIKNEITDFQFTRLTFPGSNYRYFRLLIDSQEKPELTFASIVQQEITDGRFRNCTIKKFDLKENRELRQTEIDLELQLPVPVSHLKIDVKDSFDYYRPVTIKYLADSIKTEQGWKYYYRTLTTETLNSMEKVEFKFNSTTLQKLKIIIHNQNNQPLTIDTIHVKGYVHELLVRFTEKATYFMTYGNKTAAKPYYDIDRFSDDIPMNLTTLELGDELKTEKEEIPLADPLFKNKTWLWAIMTIIILLLGWFSVKMIRKH
ncbi:MAG: DUF3999 family protein [Bacteroidales bacterium]|nr:DUF3999 family protein [Bacteroidales bacterium]